MAPFINKKNKNQDPLGGFDPTAAETKEEHRYRLAAMLAQMQARRRQQGQNDTTAEAEEIQAANLMTQTRIAIDERELRKPKQIVEPTQEKKIPVYPAVGPASVQVREFSVSHGNPKMEGVSWVNYSGDQETRIRKSFDIHPLVLEDVSETTKGRFNKTKQRTRKQWQVGHAEQRWIVEDSDQKIVADRRPIEYKPRKPVDSDGLDALLNSQVGRQEATWPKWYAQGDRPNENTRPLPDLPRFRSYNMTLPEKGNMFEAVMRYASGNNEHGVRFGPEPKDNEPFRPNLVGLSWTGMAQTTWDNTDYEVKSALGTLPPKLDCQITDYWEYSGEGGNQGYSWLEERRYEGALVDVVVHDAASMIKRMQNAFAPKGVVNGIKTVPAENVAWQVPVAPAAPNIAID